MELGMKVIVTDHHQPGLTPCPADAVINPLFGGYPFPKLCGTGVAFKLAVALLGMDTAAQWLDIVALATVADIVPLTGENRILVANGLPLIGKRPGLKALIDAAACRLPITTDTLAYQLAPRINAAGRIADANLSVRLLLTRDPAEADTLAKALDKANTERKRLEAEATAEAMLQTDEHDFVHHRVLYVRGTGWNTGVVGLVAGKLNHRFGTPVCAFTEEDGLLHGSLRGIKGVNLARCLQSCDDLLLRYGGHEMAAGVTLEASNDEAFRERLERAVSLSAADDVFVPAQEYDLPLSFLQADSALIDALERMQPFGFGNPAPVFYTEGARLERRRAVGAQGAHLQLTLRDGEKLLDGIAFGMGAEAARLPDSVDTAYTLAREEFMGNLSIKCHVEAIRPSARALAGLLATEPQAAFESALLRLIRDELTAFPAPVAGNTAPDEELIKAVSCDLVIPAAAEAIMETLPQIPPTPGQKPPETAVGGPVANRERAATFAPDGSPSPEETPSKMATHMEPTMEALLCGRQGTLFVAYTRDTATRFLSVYGDRVDVARGAPTDPRCFHTLLIHSEPHALHGHWKTIALLDGALTPNDAVYWAQSVHGAEVIAPLPSQALMLGVAGMDAGDERYRALYRLLKCCAYGGLRQTAAAAALSEAQTLAGLCAFHSLGLIRFSEIPFQYTLCEPCKCSLSDSPLLGALRALHA